MGHVEYFGLSGHGDRSVGFKDDLDAQRVFDLEDHCDLDGVVGISLEDDQPTLVAQLVEQVKDRPPMTMVGHVTSSYESPNVGRSIALALIKGGRGKIGQRVHAPLDGGKTVACTIAETVFFDPEGERLRG